MLSLNHTLKAGHADYGLALVRPKVALGRADRCYEGEVIDDYESGSQFASGTERSRCEGRTTPEYGTATGISATGQGNDQSPGACSSPGAGPCPAGRFCWQEPRRR